MKQSLVFLFILSVNTIYCQIEKSPNSFGIQIRPILPTTIGGEKSIELQKENYNFKMNQTVGFSFGGEIRKGLTKLIALEYGIFYTQRNFNLLMDLTDTNVSVNDSWSFINYELPFNSLFYIQLGKNIYMNTLMGFAFRFSPTDIKKITETGGSHIFGNYGFYNKKIGLNINANVGFEYRTNKHGYFYIGGGICVPLKSILFVETIHSVLKYTNKTIQYG